jgi:hypothetical protein
MLRKHCHVKYFVRSEDADYYGGDHGRYEVFRVGSDTFNKYVKSEEKVEYFDVWNVNCAMREYLVG